MRKILALIVLFASLSFAQSWESIYSDTTANSQAETMYVLVGGDRNIKIDSIGIAVVALGEIDLDRLIVTKGVLNTGSGSVASRFLATSAADTTTLTIDNAANTTTAQFASATDTQLNNLRGTEVVKIVVEAGAAGNDAGDPNATRVKIQKWYAK